MRADISHFINSVITMRYFKSVIIPVIALFAILAFATDDNAVVVDDGGQVAICHYTGHVASNGLGDFVILVTGSFCAADGGNIIIVGQATCVKGHRANIRLGTPCTRDNVDAVRNGPFYRGR